MRLSQPHEGREFVIKFIPTLLLIPVCLLPVGVANSADAPDATVRIAAIPAAAAAAPARAALDLRAPDLQSLQRPDSLLGTSSDGSDEQQAVTVVTGSSLPVVTGSSLPEERWGTSVSLAGIGSLYWAAAHPAQGWRVLLPILPGDEFDAYVAVSTRCTVVSSAPGVEDPCP
jgi:hypothetical protein